MGIIIKCLDCGCVAFPKLMKDEKGFLFVVCSHCQSLNVEQE